MNLGEALLTVKSRLRDSAISVEGRSHWGDDYGSALIDCVELLRSELTELYHNCDGEQRKKIDVTLSRAAELFI